MANEAISTATIAPQASLYLPLARRPAEIPSYLNVGHQSLWEISALQCCAVETMTLPARMRASVANQTMTLDHLVLSLGTDERQRVAETALRLQPHGSEPGIANGTPPTKQAAPQPCSLLTPSMQGNASRRRAANSSHQLDILRGSHLDDLADETEVTEVTSRTHQS